MHHPNAITAHAEDQQPNEAINKRRNTLPPIIKTVAPSKPKGRGGFGRGGFGKSGRDNNPYRNGPGWKKRGISAGHTYRPTAPTEHNVSTTASGRPARSSELLGSDSRSADISSVGLGGRGMQNLSDQLSTHSRYPLPRQDIPKHVLDPLSAASAEPQWPDAAIHSEGSRRGIEYGPNPSPSKRRCLQRVGSLSNEISFGQVTPNAQSKPLSPPLEQRATTAPLYPLTSPPRSYTPPLSVTTALDVENSSGASEGNTMTKAERQSPEPLVKSERSPSPLLQSQSPVETPALVNRGCTRYAPVPANCRKSNPSCVANRKAWVWREVEVLKQLGIEKERFFFRDDGMVIEWHSEMPVSASELVFRIQERHAENLRTGSIQTGGLAEPKRRRRRKNRAFSPGNGEGSAPNQAIVIGDDYEEQQANDSLSSEPPFERASRLAQSSGVSSLTRQEFTLDRCSPAQSHMLQSPQVLSTAEHLSNMITQSIIPSTPRPSALQRAGLYIYRYMTTFDLDRMSLVDAYASNAVLSCRSLSDELDPTSFIGTLHRRPVPEGQADPCIYQGHLSILTALSQLGPYVFGHQLPTLDVTQLLDPVLIGAGASEDIVLFTCETTMKSVLEGNNTPLFVIRHSVLITGAESAKQWPFVALNHQMLIHAVQSAAI